MPRDLLKRLKNMVKGMEDLFPTDKISLSIPSPDYNNYDHITVKDLRDIYEALSKKEGK